MMDDPALPAAERLGQYVKARREEQGLSIRELAKQAGIDMAGLVRIEQGKRIHSPRPDVLKKLAHALHVPVSELLTCVGYNTPHHLPECIRSCYRQLPDEAVNKATAYIERLAANIATQKRIN